MDLDLQKNYFEELKEQLNEYADLLKEKYGKEKVAHIITYGTMAAKSAIKDVAGVPIAISCLL